MPMLLACFEVLRMSLTRLYLSTLKLSVGPAESLTMRIDGATSVSVNARRCVTPSAGAMVKKSFSLFLARSFTCSPSKPTHPYTEQQRCKVGSTDPQSTGGVGFHDFADVPHELRQGRADLPVLDHEGLGDALGGARRRGDAALEVRAVFASASHA